MNILVVEEKKGQLAALTQALAQGGHYLRVVAQRAAAASLEKDKPDIAIVACADPTVALPPLVKLLSSLDDHAYRSLLAIVSPTSAAQVAAYAAGADQVASISAGADELAGHVRSTERIVQLERRLQERVLELEAALRRLALQAAARGQSMAPSAAPGRRSVRFLLAHAWTEVEDTLRRMCSEYLQHPYEQVTGTLPLPAAARGATISLTDVEDELVLDLSFLVPNDSARAVAADFTGDADVVDDEVITDVIMELANSGMGAVRAAFLGEEFRFAASTPKAIGVGQIEKLLQGAVAKRSLAFRRSAAFLHVVVTVRHQGHVKVVGSQLREGMVVVHDVLNAAGVLLVRAGTRLTESTAEKIARHVPKTVIELADGS